MYVSYTEMINHCKKVFKAYKIKDGCADDGAEVVTWSEFIGLEGLQTLIEEVSYLHPNGMEHLEWIHSEDTTHVLDGKEQSGLILGKLVADYALSLLSQVNSSIKISVKNTTKSRLLAFPAYYIAQKGYGSIFTYRTDQGIMRWILSVPAYDYPIFIEGESFERMIDEMLFKDKWGIQVSKLANHEFVLICTTDTTTLTSSIQKLRNISKNKQFVMTEPKRLKATFKKNFYNGVQVDEEDWQVLGEIGKRTLVKSTEVSREHGAG